MLPYIYILKKSRISVLQQHRYGLNPRRESGIHRSLGSTGIWDPRQGMNPRIGFWDPRESGIPGVPGNESQTRFRENESQTGVCWDGDDDGIEILYSTIVDYRSKNGIKLTDDPIPGDRRSDGRTDTSLRWNHI